MRIPSETVSIPLRILTPGYRQLHLPLPPSSHARWQSPLEKKDTLLSATLHLPSPSRLNGLYLRKPSPETLIALSLNSARPDSSQLNDPPDAALLAHISRDTGKYSIEGLASTDGALLGLRGLWNFGSDLKTRSDPTTDSDAGKASEIASGGQTESPSPSTDTRSSRPSLLSAGGEVYYSPVSSVIGLSTGLRFTTLTTDSTPTPPSPPRPSKPLSGTSATLSSQLAAQAITTPGSSSFPYTLTLTLTPLTGSLASTYSVRPTPSLSLSSRFGFNVYSWESEYVIGAEIWRKNHQPPISDQEEPENLEWARAKMATWYEDAKQLIASPITTNSTSSSNPSFDPSPHRLLETSPSSAAAAPPLQIEESVIKLRLDDGFNFRALWTGRIKSLLVSAGVTVGPQGRFSGLRKKEDGAASGGGGSGTGPWKGGFGVEVVYSS